MEFGKIFSDWQIILLRHTGDFQKSALLNPAANGRLDGWLPCRSSLSSRAGVAGAAAMPPRMLPPNAVRYSTSRRAVQSTTPGTGRPQAGHPPPLCSAPRAESESSVSADDWRRLLAAAQLCGRRARLPRLEAPPRAGTTATCAATSCPSVARRPHHGRALRADSECSPRVRSTTQLRACARPWMCRRRPRSRSGQRAPPAVARCLSGRLS